MDRQYRIASLTATILLTTGVSPIVGALGGSDAPLRGLVVALAGLGLTWAACVWCWGVARRPRPFRLVVAPIGQLATAFFMGAVGTMIADPDVELIPALGAWLLLAGLFTVLSIVFAGFLRNVDLSTPGAS